MKQNFYREARKYVYGVSIAAIPVLVHYDIISVEASALVLPLLLAVLNLTPKDVESVGYEVDLGDYNTVDELDTDEDEGE